MRSASVFFGFFLFACSEPTGGDAGTDAGMAMDSAVAFDGGSDETDAGRSIDAGTVDAGSDAGSADAGADASTGEPGPVRITLAFRGALAPDLPVVFQNADGSIVDIVETDASGSASAIMAPGGNVLAVYPQTGFVSIYYFLEVVPGDDIHVGRPDPVVSFVDVRVPASTGTNVRYWVLSECGGVLTTATSDVMRILPGCTSADLFVGAAQNGLPYGDYGAFLVPNVDLSGPPVDLSAQTYAAATTVTQRLVNTPSTMTFGSSHFWVTTPTAGWWFHAATGVSVENYERPFTPTATVTGAVPTIGASDLLVQSEVAHSHASGRTSIRNVYERVAFTTSYELDVATLTIPVLTERAVQDDEGVITWAEEPGGSADWIYGLFRTTRTGTIDRIVYAPHRGTTVRLPALPAELAASEVQAGDSVETLFFQVGSSPGGHRAFIQNTDTDRRMYLNARGDRLQVASVL
jgi:hypothetical protein